MQTLTKTNVIYNYGYLLLLQIKHFFTLIVEARQRQANYEVAKLLHRVEFRNHSFDDVLKAVENGKIHDIKS